MKFSGMLKKKSSDAWVALSVVVCSIALLVALAFGLNGRSFIPAGEKVRVRFHDVTGIQVSSVVKYAGAPAGTVSEIRMLTAEERARDSKNLIEVTLALLPDVPPMTIDAKVSIASDTLLSDKFVLISEGATKATQLGEGDVLQGISPTTFDQLVRNTDDVIEGVRQSLGGKAVENAKDLISQLQVILEKTDALLTQAQPIIQNAQEASDDVKTLLSENKTRIEQTLQKLDSAAIAMDALATRSESLIRNNEKNFTRTITDLKTTSENLKVTSTYTKFLFQDLAQRPSRLIWGGGKPPRIPPERAILESRNPIPAP